jgi:glycosyltransferase involved in cell wall biosynthesis
LFEYGAIVLRHGLVHSLRRVLIERLVIINDFVGGGGGAAELAVSAAVWIKERGIPVTFIGGEARSDPRMIDAGISFVSCGQEGLLASPLRNIFKGLYNEPAAAVVRAWIAANDTPKTVYHLHNWSQIFSPAIFSALQPVAHRLVMTAHDFFLVCPNGAFSDYPRGKACALTPMSPSCITHNCDRRSYQHKLWRVARQAVADVLRQRAVRPALITVLHEAMIPYLERGGIAASSIRVLRNPVRPFSESRIRAEQNRKIFFIGRLHEGKGPDLFLAAAQKAGVQAVLIGDGPQRDELAARFPSAEMTGWKTPAEVADLVREARAIVIPSRYPEPFGLTALEATYSGIPVIIAASAMLAPELELAGAGLAVDPRDIDAFAEALSRIAGADEDVQEMSERAFSRTRNLGTTPDEWVAGLETIYAETLGGPPQAPAQESCSAEV